MAKYVWRLIRPYVYSIGDYMHLVETNPNDLTFREFSKIQETSEVANG